MIIVKGYGNGVNGNEYARNFCVAHVDKSVGTAGIKAAIEKVRHDIIVVQFSRQKSEDFLVSPKREAGWTGGSPVDGYAA